jgi:uncharacterized repeat protein (TIGR03847 family)
MVIDFGILQHIEARSAGEPGGRSFHLRMLGQAGQSASLKLEKEHLLGLRTTLGELLAQLRYQADAETRDVVSFPPTVEYEFPVGRLGIGFSSGDRTVVLEARELEEEDRPDTVTIRAGFALSLGASLAAQIAEIIDAGRPICPQCKAAIEPEGHVCVKSNGHSRQPIPDEPSDEE